MFERIRVFHAMRVTYATHEAMGYLEEATPQLTRREWRNIGTSLLRSHTELGARIRGRQLMNSLPTGSLQVKQQFIDAWRTIKRTPMEATIGDFVVRSARIRATALQRQQNQEKRITYENIYYNGYRLRITDKMAKILQTLHTLEPQKLLIQLANNRKLLENSDFKLKEYRVANTYIFIHDLLDHFFLAYLQNQPYLNGLSLLSRYKLLEQRLGNPHTTNLLDFKGEPFAHPGHAWRASHLPYVHSQQDMSIHRMIHILNRSKNKTENQTRVLYMLQNLQKSHDPQSKVLASQLAFAYSQCLEVMKRQNLTYGPLYDLNSQQRGLRGTSRVKSFPLYDPEYLSYVCDSILLANQNKQIYINAVDVVHLRLENYLQGIIRGDLSPIATFEINLQSLLSDPKEFDIYGLLGKIQRDRWYSANWAKKTVGKQKCQLDRKYRDLHIYPCCGGIMPSFFKE